MKLWVLGSGSRGNAVVVESGSCRVLIDAGFGPFILRNRMRSVGVEPESIEACVITHEHSDHVRGANRCVRRWKWPLFTTLGTYQESRLSVLRTPTTTFVAGATLSFSGLEVKTFRTPHDAQEPIGVVITARSSGARALVCTDIGYGSATVRRMIRDVDIMVLESNHDEDMLWNGPYPPWLRSRIASKTGHLSNRDCGLLVRDSVTPRLRQIVLAHLSEKNNTPMVAYENMKGAVRGTGFRGALIPALQDRVVGPFVPSPAKSERQLCLAL